MTALFRSLLVLIAQKADSALAKHVEYLKAENEILRNKLHKRITVTPQERRRLLTLGKPLGTAIRTLISIVTPCTFLRWLQEDDPKPSRKRAAPTRKPGRPRTEAEIRALVVQLAKENAWGYTRILGELKKLGVRKIARSTVKNILKEEGLDPGPKRGRGTWSDFIERHVQTLWACDFFSAKVWTELGMVEMLVLFFIHLGSRRVHIAGMSTNPDRAWMTQQARNTAMVFAEQTPQPTMLIRDNDGKFVPEFDAILKDEGVETKKITPGRPNLNAFAERFVQTVKSECLDHFVIFGEAHLRYIISQFVSFYNGQRPHQGLDNAIPNGTPSPEPTVLKLSDVVCEQRLGGLLKSYRRAS